jgi:hypothetical protein
MFRKFYKGYFVASICVFSACSSAGTSFVSPSTEQTTTHTTRVFIEKTATIPKTTLATQMPTTFMHPDSHPEELTHIAPLENEKEILAEAILKTTQTETGEKSEIEVPDPSKVIIRTPTKNEPLSVVTIGDSVAYDADLGIKAVLESTKKVDVENRSFGGVGLSQKGFQSYLEESLSSKPEVMTIMLGGWDLAFAEENQTEYKETIEGSIEEILKVSSLIIWIGMPPTPEAEGLEESRYLINQIYKEISDLKEEVEFIDTDELLGNKKGHFARFLTTLDGESYQIRKVRDGKDDGHLCPFGAALIGGSVFKKIEESFPLLQEEDEWWLGEWSQDQRYDDPPGGCSYDPVT